MAEYRVIFSLVICVLSVSILSEATDEARKVHIVYMGALPDDVEYSPESHHISILQAAVASTSAESLLVVSYKRSFNGFAANLTDQEIQKIASLKEVVSVFPSTVLHTQTTRSWDFIGLNESSFTTLAVESDTIIGVIDTGIWPESESFSDKGFSPPPEKWKGACEGGTNFTCNNKIIGARFYSVTPNQNVSSARDNVGHGTHTASTAAGNRVKGAGFYGIAEGTARGGVPSARIAVYKVCNPSCGTDALLAAVDDAIADGVDIITMSLGHAAVIPFDKDSIAIGSFHAMQRGILVLHSAGNSGPWLASVSSLAPWLMTVAASSIDRKIVDKIVLGNGVTMIGSSVNSFTLNGTFPLINGKNTSSSCSEEMARKCFNGCLDSRLVKGKIVICELIGAADEACKAGAVGLVAATDNAPDVSFVFPLPSLRLNDADYAAAISYHNSTDHPRAAILKSETIEDPSAPLIASFSSRGPNAIAPDILKPDITAPGIEILAAFPPDCSPSGDECDKRSVKYTMLSGTSMSCPHLAGAAAYVKMFHPKWSPAAIKSSLMTTAAVMKKDDHPLGEFEYGSGLVNPVSAVNPGLVYESHEGDYTKFLCSIGFKEEKIRLLTGNKSFSCPDKGSPRDLNYPAMTAHVLHDQAFTVQFHRRVRNVGLSNSTYEAKVSPSSAFDVQVVPAALSFKSRDEEMSFELIVKGKPRGLPINSSASASLVWTDQTHYVRSAIVLHTLEAITI